jgi:hypothetical protein
MCTLHRSTHGDYVRLCHVHGDRAGYCVRVPKGYALTGPHYPHEGQPTHQIGFDIAVPIDYGAYRRTAGRYRVRLQRRKGNRD